MSSVIAAEHPKFLKDEVKRTIIPMHISSLAVTMLTSVTWQMPPSYKTLYFLREDRVSSELCHVVFRINSDSTEYHLRGFPSATPWARSHPKHNSDFRAPKGKKKKEENKEPGPLSFIASVVANSDALPQGSCIITLSFILTSNGLIWVLYLTFLYLSKSTVFM